ncbi:MAG: hypothetical protein Q6363_002020 [Candidatus Njordarchaeota archaeon]
MSQQQALPKPLSLTIKCPECGRDVHVIIKPQDFEDSLSGLVRIPIEHSEPSPHMLILDIDQSGFVRGAYLYRYISKPRIVKIGGLIENLGIKNLAYILYYLLKGDKIYLHGDEKTIKMISDLAFLLGEKNIIVSNKNEAKERIDIKKIKKPKATMRPLLQIVLRAANLSSDDARTEWIKKEYSKLKEGLELLKDIIATKNSWTLDSLLVEIKADVNKDDLRLLLDILENKGYKVSTKIKDTEYKIKSMFV